MQRASIAKEFEANFSPRVRCELVGARITRSAGTTDVDGTHGLKAALTAQCYGRCYPGLSGEEEDREPGS
jgi:hypothetical protein